MPGLDHRLGEQREVRGARARDRRDRVHRVLGHATTRPRCASTLLGQREVLVARRGAPAQMPAIPSCTVDGAFGIARTTARRPRGGARSARSGSRRRPRARSARRDSSAPISPSSASMSCGLTASTTIVGAGDRLGVRGRRLDAVALAQLGDALLAAAGDDDVGCQPELSSPRAAPRRSCRRRGSRSPLRHAPSLAVDAAVRPRPSAGSRPRAKPASRYTLASPAHSPYGRAARRSPALDPAGPRARAGA